MRLATLSSRRALGLAAAGVILNASSESASAGSKITLSWSVTDSVNQVLGVAKFTPDDGTSTLPAGFPLSVPVAVAASGTMNVTLPLIAGVIVYRVIAADSSGNNQSTDVAIQVMPLPVVSANPISIPVPPNAVDVVTTGAGDVPTTASNSSLIWLAAAGAAAWLLLR